MPSSFHKRLSPTCLCPPLVCYYYIIYDINVNDLLTVLIIPASRIYDFPCATKRRFYGMSLFVLAFAMFKLVQPLMNNSSIRSIKKEFSWSTEDVLCLASRNSVSQNDVLLALCHFLACTLTSNILITNLLISDCEKSMYLLSCEYSSIENFQCFLFMTQGTNV